MVSLIELIFNNKEFLIFNNIFFSEFSIVIQLQTFVNFEIVVTVLVQMPFLVQILIVYITSIIVNLHVQESCFNLILDIL